MLLALALTAAALSTAMVRAQTAFTATPFGIGFQNGHWAAAQLNSDGIGDLVAVVTPSAGQPAPLITAVSTPTGYNTTLSFLSGQTTVSGAVFGDLNGDGFDDFIVADAVTFTANIHLGNGAGAFTPAASPFAGLALLAMVDADGDGDQDVIGLVNNTPRIAFGDGNANLTLAPIGQPFSAAPAAFALGDLDGDNDVDFVWSGAPPLRRIEVWLQQPNGTFVPGPAHQLPVTADPAITLVDHDGDGDRDVAFLLDNLANNGPPNTIALGINDGTGALTLGLGSPLPIAGGGAFTLRAGDFDDDGFGDVVAARAGTGPSYGLWTAFGAPGGLHRTSVLLQAPAAEHHELQVFDWDGDGDADVMLRKAGTGAAFEIALSMRYGAHAGGAGPLLGGCGSPLSLALGGSLQPGGTITLATDFGPPGALAALAIGFAPGRTTPLPGCYLAIGGPIAATLLRTLTPAGTGAAALSLPPGGAMTGVRFVAQDVVFDPFFMNGINATNGVLFIGG